MCALPLVIPCSGAAGHHRRFHRAATSKKFPFSTFYVLIHHYWNSRSSPNNFALSLSIAVSHRSSSSLVLVWGSFQWRVYWCGGGPKGHSLPDTLVATRRAGPNGNLTHFFFLYFLIFLLGPLRGRFGDLLGVLLQLPLEISLELLDSFFLSPQLS